MSDTPVPAKPAPAKPAPAPEPEAERLYHEHELTGGAFEAVGGGMYRKVT